MKKIFTLIVTTACFIMPVVTNAQGIYQFWSTTAGGGKDDNGTFFSTKYDGTSQVNYSYFTSANSGRSWEGNQPVAYNGKFYSLLTYGGVNDDGIISEFDPATNIYTTKVNLHDAGLGSVSNAMVLLGNKLYGVSGNNGSLAPSALFEFNPANGAIVKPHLFVEASGYAVEHEPAVFNNKLYGLTMLGGNNNEGVIYEFDPATGVYSVKHHFSGAMSGSARSGFTVYANKLWCTDGNGIIFSFDPATNIVSQKQDLAPLGAGEVYGCMAVLNNKLYGVASHGGPGDEGFVFVYDPALNSLNTELDFTAATVNNRFTLLSYNGLLYGSAFFGGATGNGELFSYNPVTNNYTTLKSFNNASGGTGEGRILLYNNKLYGWLLNGGYVSGISSLFEYNPANNQFALKISLGDNELQTPNGQLMYYKHKLYGGASAGGSLKGGGIYAFDLQTKEFEVKIPMAETAGKFSDQGGFVLYNDKFYGVTAIGGTNERGTLFQYDPNNNEYTTLFNFGGADGEYPYGQLVVFNGKIYGTCRTGSTSNKGTIFELNPANNTVLTKVAFDGTRGGNPQCALTVYNGRLFGVAATGGINNHGTIFEYLPLPNALVKLADFKADVTGSTPLGKVTGYDNKLWGVTQSSNLGSYSGFIYQFDLVTGVLSKKKELDYTTGNMAMAGMTMLNNKFYGMTNLGGSPTATGVLFEYDPATNNYTVKADFEPLNGKWARRTELAAVPAATAHGSGGSCINTQTVNINAANASSWI
ncbi:MAG: PQQ-like beta-propeller repeat protein, partial [Rhizobacter sp.]|nr:PQQ-like beta-propeller repeat protein [Ferruginibacter sp.]